MSQQKKKSFVAGALILAAFGLFGKVIGAFYRPMLSALIGVETGMAIFQLPYSVYNFLLVISSAGLPTAISRMVSARIATQDRAGAREVARVARRVLFGTGLAATLLMLALSGPLAAMTGDADAAPAFVALAPAVFLVCMISSYRGYFQGMQRMLPTALSQLVEQLGKMLIGFPLAAYMMKQGGFVWGAVGAITGVTLSELAALALMLGANAGQRARDRDLQRPTVRETGLLRSLFAIAVPITIGSAMMPIVGMADTFQVVNRLKDAGFTIEQARAMFGPLTAIVKPIVEMPAVVTLALSTALVPALSSALALKDRAGARNISIAGLKLAALIGMPAALGMSMLSEPIVRLLFGSQSEAAKLLGSQMLEVMAIGVLFLAFIQTSTGIFQGLGRPIIPVLTMGVGLVAKLCLNHILIGMPAVGAMGAVYGTLACYIIAAALNIWFIARLASIRAREFATLLRPIAATVGMGAALIAVRYFIHGRVGNTTYLAIGLAVGMGVYAVLVLLTGAITPQDLELMPGGRHLERLIYRGRHRGK